MTECLNHNSTEEANGAEGGMTAITYASHHTGQSPSHIKDRAIHTGECTMDSSQWH